MTVLRKSLSKILEEHESVKHVVHIAVIWINSTEIGIPLKTNTQRQYCCFRLSKFYLFKLI